MNYKDSKTTLIFVFLKQPEVQVANIGPTKLWIKIVCQKKRGGLTKLMEAMNALGFDINDTSATASKGAILITSSVEVGETYVKKVIFLVAIKKLLPENIKICNSTKRRSCLAPCTVCAAIISNINNL